MSDVRQYYYMRLREDFFTSNEVSLLEAMDNGYVYSNILLKMYLRSIQGGGRLMFNQHRAFTTKLLAGILKHDEEIVVEALSIFEELGLIETLSNGVIYMLDFENMIGKSSNEADRKRAYRKRMEDEKQAIIEQENTSKVTEMTNVHQMSDISPLEKSREEKIREELELEKRIEKRKEELELDKS